MPESREKILLVDDEPSALAPLETLLDETYMILTATSGNAAWQILQEEEIAVAVVDLALPDLNGLELLRRLRENNFSTELIMVTGHGSIDSAVEAMRIGAYDYLTKPVEGERLQQIIAKAIEKNALTVSNRALATQLRELTSYEELTGQSESMREIYKLIEAVAKSEASILITGESGTGKELVARAVHQRSARSKTPFVAVNCSALPADILENEFFGHEKGAFTGALAEKPGCFELADHG
ncbi:MAG: sigma-54-dependent transcriptional regulator, partial [bacterium]